MAQCDVQTILTDGRCFHGVNPAILRASVAALWCQVGEGLAGGIVDNIALQSIDDNEWYEFNIAELSPGNAVAQPGQVPVAPGDNAYLVLTDVDNGLKYQLEFYGTPPNVFWQINGESVEDETPTTLYVGSRAYNLQIVGGGSTIQLTLIP